MGKVKDLRNRATEKDETGFYFDGIRYYNSELGRFLQPDRSKFNHNPFVFIGYNPIMNIIPRMEPNHFSMQTNYANWMKVTNPWWLAGSIYYPEKREYDHNQMSYYPTEMIPPLSLINRTRVIFMNGFKQII
jgi:RHS repeat-associated protein